MTIPAGRVAIDGTITADDNSELENNADATIMGAVQPGGSGANNPAAT